MEGGCGGEVINYWVVLQVHPIMLEVREYALLYAGGTPVLALLEVHPFLLEMSGAFSD